MGSGVSPIGGSSVVKAIDSGSPKEMTDALKEANVGTKLQFQYKNAVVDIPATFTKTGPDSWEREAGGKVDSHTWSSNQITSSVKRNTSKFERYTLRGVSN